MILLATIGDCITSKNPSLSFSFAKFIKLPTAKKMISISFNKGGLIFDSVPNVV